MASASGSAMSRSDKIKELRKCRQRIKDLKGRLKRAYLQVIKKEDDYLKQYNSKREEPVDIAQRRLRSRRELEGHFGKIYSIDTSSQGELVSGGLDEKVIVCAARLCLSLCVCMCVVCAWQIWDIGTGLKKGVISECVKQVTAVGFSPNGQTLAIGGMSNGCCIYSRDKTKEPRMELEGHEGYITKSEFLSDSRLATASGDGTVRLWDITKGQHLCTYRDHGKHVTSMSVNRKDKVTILTSSYDGVVKVWDSRVAIKHFDDPLSCSDTGHTASVCGHKNEVTCVQWFPSYDSCFASGGDDGKIRLWDYRTRRPLNVYDVLSEVDVAEPKSQVNCIAFLKSGRALYAGVDVGAYCLGYDTITGEHIQFLRHTQDVNDLAVDDKGEVLISASWNCKVTFWA